MKITSLLPSLLVIACIFVATTNANSTEQTLTHSLRKNQESLPFLSKQKRQRRASEDDGHEEGHGDHDHDDHDDKPNPWGAVIGGTLLVNLATILGVIFLVPVCRKQTALKKSILDIIVPSFAAGALIATGLFLTIPESIVLIQSHIMEGMEEHDDHGDEGGEDHGDEHGDEHDDHGFEFYPGTIWRFASALLAGFLFPILMKALFPNHDHHEIGDGSHQEIDGTPNDDENGKAGQNGDENTDESTDEASGPVPLNMSLILSILVGDSLCNFCDGVFIGIALKLCDSSISIAVIGITLYHELAQELADYFLLTRYAGLTPFKALLVNFLTGLTVVFGGLLVLVVNLNNMTTGVLLAIASGVYIYIAGCECIPRVQETAKTAKDKLILLALFIAGVIPIGLTLIGHVHCDAH